MQSYGHVTIAMYFSASGKYDYTLTNAYCNFVSTDMIITVGSGHPPCCSMNTF